MGKYHINPKTGNPGKCSATVNCPFGGESEHYETTTLARKAFEQRQDEFTLTPAAQIKLFKRQLVRKENVDWNAIERDLGFITEWEKPWTADEISNLQKVKELVKLLETESFTDETKTQAEELIDSMVPYVVPPPRRFDIRNTTNDTSWRARDKMIHSLANYLLVRREADELTHEPAEPITNPAMLNLTEAQEAALKGFNRPESDFYDGPYIGDVEEHYQEAIARVVRGDEPFLGIKSSSEGSLLPLNERLFNVLHPDSNSYNQQLYLAAVFPVRELKTEMDRVGVTNVSVTPFYNTREWGNAYSVLQPDGSVRAFSVYEHRNTDSIIINGKENWNGKELPYAADSKSKFYGEYGPDDRKRAAQSLAFFMAQAQRGELSDDDALIANAPHKDWNAILDKQIPGFKEWRIARQPEGYIEPQEETEDELLNRLDF